MSAEGTRDLPQQVRRFSNGKPHQFFLLTSYGDSAYAHDEDDLAEWLKLYAGRDRQVAVYELRSQHEPVEDSSS